MAVKDVGSSRLFLSEAPWQQRPAHHTAADSCCLHLWALPDSSSPLQQSAKALTDRQCVGTQGELSRLLQRERRCLDSAQVLLSLLADAFADVCAGPQQSKLTWEPDRLASSP